MSIKNSPPEVHPSSLFASDLKFDSLLRHSLNEKLANEFCVELPDDAPEIFVNIQSAVDYFSAHPKAR